MTTEKVNATVNGVTAFLFSCTGPVAIIITVAETTGLSDRHIASWLFGGFAITGLYTLYYSLHYRQPLTFAWTIPGTVLLLSALDHLQFEQVVSAFLVTALVIALIGLSGWMQRIMAWVPHSIVMAMVAGIFVEFGLKLIDAFSDSALIASSMVVGYVCCALSVRLQRFVPPILAALLIGAVMVMLTGSFKATSAPMAFITVPVIFMPQFSLQAIIELVIPLSITVLMVQNGQGFAVLGHAGHKPPANSMTTACGTGSLLLGLVGSVSMCVTGPANAILASSGAKEVQYVGGITYGVLAITFGLFSPYISQTCQNGRISGLDRVIYKYPAPIVPDHRETAGSTTQNRPIDRPLWPIGGRFGVKGRFSAERPPDRSIVWGPGKAGGDQSGASRATTVVNRA